MEKKFVDGVIGAVILDPLAGDRFAINLTANGSGASERIGEVVTIKSMVIPLIIENAGIAADGTFMYIVDIIWDRQPNGALATLPEMFNSGKDTLSLRNMGRRNRFHCLYTSGPFSLGSGTDVNTPDGVAWKITISGCNLVTIYTAATATFGAIGTGTLLIVIRNDGGGGDNMHSFRCHPRVRYIDGKGPAKENFGKVSITGGRNILHIGNRR